MRDNKYLGAWLKAGFLVVATDYQGLGTPGIHPYSNFRAASYSLLDSIRAVSSDKTLNASRTAVLVGQSQGAGAVVAAAGYAPGYMSDVDLRGVIATGLPNLTRSAVESGLASSATDTMVTAAYAMIGYEMSRIHPEAFSSQAIFSPQGLEIEQQVGQMCLVDLMKETARRGLDPAKAFAPGMLRKLWDTDVDLRSYPTLSLNVPLFVGIGGTDTAALPMTTLSLVNDLCAADNDVAVRIYRGEDHNGVVNAAAVDAIAFAMAAVSREVVRGVCDKGHSNS